ncbi:MAG TPA: hypothetical protein VFE56_10475 [Candidatus Binataceae bacterium]|jgi:hypothetical protein|nr:hypothetical protein [Candidatus Binataceae bacterium]
MSRLKISIPVVVTMMVLMMPGRGRAQLATTIPTPSPAPTAQPTPRAATATRLFFCNCTSAGHPVTWAGTVQASSYFQARQLGTGQCLAFLGAKPISPVIPTPAAGFAAAPSFVGLPSNPCSNCACN